MTAGILCGFCPFRAKVNFKIFHMKHIFRNVGRGESWWSHQNNSASHYCWSIAPFPECPCSMGKITHITQDSPFLWAVSMLQREVILGTYQISVSLVFRVLLLLIPSWTHKSSQFPNINTELIFNFIYWWKRWLKIDQFWILIHSLQCNAPLKRMFKTFLFETAPTLHLQYHSPYNLYLLIFYYLFAKLKYTVLIKITNKFTNKLLRFPRCEGNLHTDKVPLKELELHHFGKNSELE